MAQILKKLKSGQISPKNRPAFWRFCAYATNSAACRAAAGNFPYSIDAHAIDRLLVDQNWRCAVTGIPFDPPGGKDARSPFSPSIDRIIPSLGYVDGNVRLVSCMVNCAMAEWGEEPLRRLLKEAKLRPARAPPN